MKGEHDEAKRILKYVLALNMAVAAAKAAFGLWANSLSMVADAAHSLFDAAANVIGLAGLRMAGKPPDHGHPYGHGKFESLATAGIAALLFLTAMGIVHGVIERAGSPASPNITAATFIVMAATTALNVMVAAYEGGRGRKLGSQILVADSQHTRSDVYASAAVMTGFVAVGAGYPVVDSVVALLIAALIAKTAYGIIKDCSLVLCDASALDQRAVCRIVESVPGVRGCHRIRTRGAAGRVYVDLHVQVAADMSVEQAHGISEDVETRLKREFRVVGDVVVHIEPD